MYGRLAPATPAGASSPRSEARRRAGSPPWYEGPVATYEREVYQAVEGRGPGQAIDLAGIIGVVDELDHGILTREELVDALRRLHRRGKVAEYGHHLYYDPSTTRGTAPRGLSPITDWDLERACAEYAARFEGPRGRGGDEEPAPPGGAVVVSLRLAHGLHPAAGDEAVAERLAEVIDEALAPPGDAEVDGFEHGPGVVEILVRPAGEAADLRAAGARVVAALRSAACPPGCSVLQEDAEGHRRLLAEITAPVPAAVPQEPRADEEGASPAAPRARPPIDLEEGPMCPGNPDWIWVTGPEQPEVLDAIERQFGPTGAEGAASVRVSIVRLGEGSHALLFSAPLPLCDFANLVNWLDDPQILPHARACVGWITSPASGERFLLCPERENALGDTALGLPGSGRAVRICVPDGRVAPTSRPVRPVREPRLPPVPPAGSLPGVEVVVETGSGNPAFAVTETSDAFDD